MQFTMRGKHKCAHFRSETDPTVNAFSDRHTHIIAIERIQTPLCHTALSARIE